MHPIPGNARLRQGGCMNKHHPLKSCRAAAALAAAAVLAVGTATASAQTIDTNIFGGAGTPASLTATSTANAAFASGPFGPNFNGHVSIGLGALTNLTETISGGTYSISESGLTGLSGSFDATKTFAGSSLAAGQFYRLTLTTSTVAAVNLLSGFNIQLSTTSNGNTTVVLDTSTGTGLAGVTNLVGLFNTNGVETLTFQAPAGLPATPLTVTFSGALTASALGSTIAFTSAAINPVPEPGTWAAIGMGIFGFVVARAYRRPA